MVSIHFPLLSRFAPIPTATLSSFHPLSAPPRNQSTDARCERRQDRWFSYRQQSRGDRDARLGCEEGYQTLVRYAISPNSKFDYELGWSRRIEELPMKDAKKAVENVKANKIKYRYVLTQDLV